MVIRVYVGDLGDHGSRTELERAFSKFGNVNEVWVARNPPGFAFVFFDSYREAEGACRELDGSYLCGVRVRVEIAKGPEKGEKHNSGPKCHECGRPGHSDRECTRRPGYVYRGKNSEYRRGERRSRSRSHSRDRNYHERRSPERDFRRGRNDSYLGRRRSRSRSFERGRRSPPDYFTRRTRRSYNENM